MANPDQEDEDGDGFGDMCDIDFPKHGHGGEPGSGGLLECVCFYFGWHCVGSEVCGDFVIRNNWSVDVNIVRVCTQCASPTGECAYFYVQQPTPQNQILKSGEEVSVTFCFDPYEIVPRQADFRWYRCWDAAVYLQVAGDPRIQAGPVYLEGKVTREGCFLGRMDGQRAGCSQGQTDWEQDFDRVEVGSIREKTVTLTNTGCMPLTVEELISSHSAFTVMTPVPLVIAEKSSRDVLVRFAPTEVGEVTGVLTVVSDAQNRNESGEPIGDVEVVVKGIGFALMTGDVNGDEQVNVFDVQYLVDIILHPAVPGATEIVAADVDQNGVIDIIDAIVLVNLILNGTTKSVVTPEVMSYLESLSPEMSSADHGRLMDLVKGIAVPDEYSLSQNYPNPFNPQTEIAFGLPVDSRVSVTVYNVLGQVVTELVNGELPAGNHVVNWNASDMASGVYFYRITANQFTASRSMVLMK